MRQMLENVEDMLNMPQAPLLDKGVVCADNSDAIVVADYDTVLVTEVEDSACEYLCGTCKNICVGNPIQFNELSIECSTCKNWFHFGCLGFTGDEPFIKKKNVKWFCKKCSIEF